MAGGEGPRIAFCDNMWLGHGVFVSIGGDRENEGSDQSSRQEFGCRH